MTSSQSSYCTIEPSIRSVPYLSSNGKVITVSIGGKPTIFKLRASRLDEDSVEIDKVLNLTSARISRIIEDHNTKNTDLFYMVVRSKTRWSDAWDGAIFYNQSDKDLKAALDAQGVEIEFLASQGEFEKKYGSSSGKSGYKLD